MSAKKQDRKQLQKERQKKFDFYEVPAFEKKFRGYESGAVDDYLSALVDAYTGMYAECEALRAAQEEHRLFREKVAHVLIEREITHGDAAA